MLELHDIRHSTVSWTYNPDTMQDFSDIFGKTLLIELKYSEHHRLPTKRFQCDENGSADPFNCLQTYLQEKLNCSFPWMKSENHGTQCISVQDLFNLTQDILMRNQTIENELKQTSCWITNCIDKRWSSRYSREKTNDNNRTIIELFLDASGSAEIWQENRLYGLTNFIADFGGYLGLFLGFSILSMIEGMINFIAK